MRLFLLRDMTDAFSTGCGVESNFISKAVGPKHFAIISPNRKLENLLNLKCVSRHSTSISRHTNHRQVKWIQARLMIHFLGDPRALEPNSVS